MLPALQKQMHRIKTTRENPTQFDDIFNAHKEESKGGKGGDPRAKTVA